MAHPNIETSNSGWWSPAHSPRSSSARAVDDMWNDNADTTIVDVSQFYTLPYVSVLFDVKQDALHVGLGVETSDNPSLCEARVLQITLDDVVVAKNRGRDMLTFQQPLCELENGKHVVQYVCQFDSGDMVVYYRTLVYRGNTVRGDAVDRPVAHSLLYHGSGTATVKKAVMWKLSDVHELPCTVVLRGAWNCSLYLQACTTNPLDYQPPRTLKNGEARLVIVSDRHLVIGVSGNDVGIVAYDIFVESQKSECSEKLSWSKSPRVPAHYAVCIGISKYTFVTPLHWADADAVSWLDYLTSKQYVYRLFGDGVSSYSPYTPHGLGRQKEISACMQYLSDVVQDGDTVAFTDSGHGAGDGTEHSWLVCLDDTDTTHRGTYDDVAFASDISKLTEKGANVFVFIDACHSFGFAYQLEKMCNPDSWFIATTCTVNGVGYDDNSVHHGSFTYTFLIKGLQGRFKNNNPTMGEAFEYARSIYRFRANPNNMPQCAGNPNLKLM